MTDTAAREIAHAILRLAEAQQAEADATRSLVDLREREMAEAAEAAASRLASDTAARGEIAEFRASLEGIAPALQMLIAIAKSMRGEIETKP